MPDLAADMDPSREIAAIPGVELPAVNREGDKGMRISDMFLNVRLFVDMIGKCTGLNEKDILSLS